MANQVSNVSFQSPGYDYGADISDIERRRAMAAALQKESLDQGAGTQSINGWAVRQPSMQFGKMAQALAGAYGNKQADEKQRELAQKSQDDYKNMLAQGIRQLQGSPATKMAEDASGNVTPAQAAVAPDPMAAMGTFGSHPMGAQFMPLATDQMHRDALVAALTAGQGAAPRQPAPPMPAQNPMAGGPGGSVMGPQGAAGGGGPVASVNPQPVAPPPQAQAPQPIGQAGGSPAAAWILADKTGKGYLEAVQKDRALQNVREGGAVFDPVTNRPLFQNFKTQPGQMINYGPNGPTMSQVPGFGPTQTSINSIPNPSHAMIPLKTSSGQDIQLTQPEYVQWQQTRELPARFGGRPPFNPLNPPAGGGTGQGGGGGGPAPKQDFGIIGAGQTQQDIIRQEGQRAANTEAAKEFISEQRQNYSKLRDVPATLENMERGKVLAANQAAQFMGPFGESKLALTKFFRNNVPGMGNLKTEGVTSAEELQSTMFNQVMDNLKKMDASPSQYQQQVMQEAFGTLRTDPASVPKIMDVFGDILRNRVAIHNETVKSAEGRGTVFPYDVNVKLPERKEAPKPQQPGTLNPAEQQELDALRARFGRR